MSSPDGECRSVLYEVMKIQESVSDRAEVQNGRLWASLFINDLGSDHPLKNWHEESTQNGEMGGLFEPIIEWMGAAHVIDK